VESDRGISSHVLFPHRYKAASLRAYRVWIVKISQPACFLAWDEKRRGEKGEITVGVGALPFRHDAIRRIFLCL
jgi:hypothetical protein